MNEVQIYIGNVKLDLFEDENISLTSSIQNSKDIGKIFTDFTQSFSVPASATNNKIFKHYYKPDIASGYDFDARVKADAIIELNHATFRIGKLRLDGVQLKQGQPSSYKVTFFGSTVTLTDLLGEDRLSDIGELDAYDHPYDAQEARLGFTGSLMSGNIVYPLISHTNRLYYDSAGTTTTDGNLYYDNTKPSRGVQYTDLKPALKVSAIIDSIETKYGITFDSEFFDGTLTGYENVFPDLFMWLHAKKGAMQTAEGVVTKGKIKYFLFESGTDIVFFDFPDAANMLLQPILIANFQRNYQIDLTITPVENGEYSIYIYRDNVLLHSIINTTGTHNTIPYVIQGNEQTSIYVEIETSGGITNYDASWNINQFETSTDPFDPSDVVTNAVYLSDNQSLITSVSIKDNIPNIKVIDFLRNLFKMFNLTSYVKQNGNIYVEPLDVFYQQGDITDISKYIDNTDTNINRAIPYKTVSFEFPVSKTFHAEKRNQIFGGVQFGNLTYHQYNFDGTEYRLEVGFEKMLYERMTNQNAQEPTSIQWGWTTDYKGDSAEDIDKASSVVGDPILFYNVSQSTNTTIGGVPANTPISLVADGHFNITTYNRPSNVNLQQDQTLNFGSEIDEFNLVQNDNSIYENFYKTYILQVFNRQARMFTYVATLPNKVLLNYSVNDTFIIGDTEYIINTVKTDAKSGNTKLELINKLF